MTDREKLIGLLIYAKDLSSIEREVDFLLANGVTFATDTNDGGKWIRVEDRLPIDGVRVLTACDDGLVRLNISKGGFPAVVNRQRRFSEATHWMPLPEPPRED